MTPVVASNVSPAGSAGEIVLVTVADGVKLLAVAVTVSADPTFPETEAEDIVSDAGLITPTALEANSETKALLFASTATPQGTLPVEI